MSSEVKNSGICSVQPVMLKPHRYQVWVSLKYPMKSLYLACGSGSKITSPWVYRSPRPGPHPLHLLVLLLSSQGPCPGFLPDPSPPQSQQWGKGWIEERGAEVEALLRGSSACLPSWSFPDWVRLPKSGRAPQGG